jgi:hypothetical protein
MKYTVGIVLLFLAFSLISSCATVDPLKDLPETEYQQAQKYRTRIENLDFAQYAPDEFATGETAFKAGEENYKKDNLAAKASFDEANGSYRIVMRKGIEVRMKMAEDEIAPVKEKAMDIKADVAAPTEYTDAKGAHDRAVALANEENWEEAEPVFAEAKQKYETAYEAAQNKKDKADTQFDETNQVLNRLKGLAGATGTDQPQDEMIPDDETYPDDEMLPEDDMPPDDEMLPDDETYPDDEMPSEDEGI